MKGAAGAGITPFLALGFVGVPLKKPLGSGGWAFLPGGWGHCLFGGGGR